MIRRMMLALFVGLLGLSLLLPLVGCNGSVQPQVQMKDQEELEEPFKEP